MSFGDLERNGGFSGGYQSTSIHGIYGRGGDEEYIRLSQKVTSSIQQISSNITAIQRLTDQVGTSKDTEELRERLAQITEKTRDIVQQTTKDIQLLGKLDGGSSSDSHQRKMQQKKLSKNFQDVLKSYAEIQKLSAQRQREYVAQAKRRTESMKYEASHIPSDSSGEETKHMLVEEKRKQQVMALENEIEFNEAIIAEREEGIKNIESEIMQINEIFRDLSHMVKEQGEMLDTIENNVSDAVEHVESANVELKSANKHQKSARNKMCCLLVIGITVLAALVLIIVFNVI